MLDAADHHDLRADIDHAVGLLRAVLGFAGEDDALALLKLADDILGFVAIDIAAPQIADLLRSCAGECVTHAARRRCLDLARRLDVAAIPIDHD